MQEFILFLQENWRFLTELILLVISLIIVLVKPSAKIKVPESVLAVAFKMIPELIVSAEDLIGPGNGSSKKDYVVSELIKWIAGRLGVDESKVIKSVKDEISEQVEVILSCPVRKKGD